MPIHVRPARQLPQSVRFRAIAYGESLKILKRCSKRSDAMFHIRKFHERLRKRGYQEADFQNETLRAIRCFQSPSFQSTGRNPMRKTPSLNVHRMHVHFSKCTNLRVIRKVLKRHQAILAGVSSDVGVALHTQKNIFRLLCDSTWRRPLMHSGG